MRALSARPGTDRAKNIAFAETLINADALVETENRAPVAQISWSNTGFVRRRRRRGPMISLLVLLGLGGGAYALHTKVGFAAVREWFVEQTSRVSSGADDTTTAESGDDAADEDGAETRAPVVEHAAPAENAAGVALDPSADEESAAEAVTAADEVAAAGDDGVPAGDGDSAAIVAAGEASDGTGDADGVADGDGSAAADDGGDAVASGEDEDESGEDGDEESEETGIDDSESDLAAAESELEKAGVAPAATAPPEKRVVTAPAKPPAPAKREPVVVETLADAQRLIELGKHEQALDGLRKLGLKNPRSAYIPYMVGHLYFEKKYWRDGIKSYNEAISKNRQYRSRKVLIENVIRALSSDNTRSAAVRLLGVVIGRPALPYLRRAAKSDHNPVVKRRAAWLVDYIIRRSKRGKSFRRSSAPVGRQQRPMMRRRR